MFPRLRVNSSCHVVYIHFLLARLKNTNSCFIPTHEMCQKSHFRLPSLSLLIPNVFRFFQQFLARLFRVTQVFIRFFCGLRMNHGEVKSKPPFVILKLSPFLPSLLLSTADRKQEKPFFVLTKTFTQIRIAFMKYWHKERTVLKSQGVIVNNVMLFGMNDRLQVKVL